MATSGLMRRLLLIWPILSWNPTCGGTRRGTCGFGCLPIRPGGTCCRIQRFTGMIRGDVSWGNTWGCGCFFLVAGRRGWYSGLTLLLRGKQSSRWLSGCFMPVVVQRQVLGWFSAEHESLFRKIFMHLSLCRFGCCLRSTENWIFREMTGICGAHSGPDRRCRAGVTGS